MFKSNKGVTLVALVITIIVLLILAGVSISLIAGDNGILTKGKKAADETEIKNVESAFSLAVGSVQANFFDDQVNNMSVKQEDYYTITRLNEYIGTDYKFCGDTAGAQPTETKLTKGTNTIHMCKKNASADGTVYVVSYTMSDNGYVGSVSAKVKAEAE